MRAKEREDKLKQDKEESKEIALNDMLEEEMDKHSHLSSLDAKEYAKGEREAFENNQLADALIGDEPYQAGTLPEEILERTLLERKRLRRARYFAKKKALEEAKMLRAREKKALEEGRMRRVREKLERAERRRRDTYNTNRRLHVIPMDEMESDVRAPDASYVEQLITEKKFSPDEDRPAPILPASTPGVHVIDEY